MIFYTMQAILLQMYMYFSVASFVQGADMNAKDKDGHTARSLAYNKHHVRTVTLLDNAVFIYRRMSGKHFLVHV